MPLNDRQNGFTLVEILVALAIGIVLAAVVLPNVIGGVDRSRVTETADSFEGIARAMTAMYEDTGRYPGQLSHLTEPITTAQAGLCGDPPTAYDATAVASWAGPYLNRTVPQSGLPLPVGVARNALSYASPPPVLRIHVDDVTERDAVELNRLIDDDDDATAGGVRWGAVSGSGLTELVYARPVKCP